jgi:type IV pilus assembly protein PilE
MKTRGFTLIELMIVVAILAIVAAIAIPAYNGYIRESRLGAMRMNLDTLRIAVEAHRLESQTGTYGPVNTKYTGKTTSGTFSWTPTATPPLDWHDWKPTGDSGNYEYSVTPTSVSGVGPSYDMTAKDSSGLVLSCTNRMTSCTP